MSNEKEQGSSLHKLTKLIQAWVEEDMHTWIEQAAAAEGLSVASYIRRTFKLKMKRGH